MTGTTSLNLANYIIGYVPGIANPNDGIAYFRNDFLRERQIIRLLLETKLKEPTDPKFIESDRFMYTVALMELHEYRFRLIFNVFNSVLVLYNPSD